MVDKFNVSHIRWDLEAWMLTEMPQDELAKRGGGRGELWGRMECATLFDPFEPTRIKHALSQPDNLGYLIFGPEWRTLSPVTPTQSYDEFVEANPLARLFKQKGIVTPSILVVTFNLDLQFRCPRCPHLSKTRAL